MIGARDFAQQIYDLALLRALIGVGRDLVEGALDTSEDVAPLAQIERAETELYKVAEEGGAEGKAKSFADATKEALAMAERALNSGGHLSGITTGLDSLNSKIGGLHKSDLIIVAGRPGMGKSSLAHQHRLRRRAAASCATMRTASSRASRPAPPVALFSLEMSADQLATRILAEQSGISSENLRMGKISQQEFRQLARAAAELQSLPLYIDDTPGLTIAALRARARRLKRQKGIGMVIVDYLQLLQGTGKNSNENRVQEISEISRGLKQLAKELDVPVIGLSQLSRAVEQREDKRPQLSDLQGIGLDRAGRRHRALHLPRGLLRRLARAQGAQGRRRYKIVEAYQQWQQDMGRVYGMAEVIVAKQRHGSTGKVRLKFDSRVTKFSDVVDEGYLPEMRG